jgi:Uma2 family endonuclease
MAEAARKPGMTVAEFLAWDDGSDTRYELIDGTPVAMAPAASFHGTIVMNAGGAINRRLEARPPCRSQGEAGVSLDDRSFYVADVAATCAPIANTPTVVDPFLIVEVLSPSTKAFDLQIKVKRYSRLASVAEIWLVDSERRWVQVWQRSGEVWIVRILEAEESFASAALGDCVTLDEIYRNVTFEGPDSPAAGG